MSLTKGVVKCRRATINAANSWCAGATNHWCVTISSRCRSVVTAVRLGLLNTKFGNFHCFSPVLNGCHRHRPVVVCVWSDRIHYVLVRECRGVIYRGHMRCDV